MSMSSIKTNFMTQKLKNIYRDYNIYNGHLINTIHTLGSSYLTL